MRIKKIQSAPIRNKKINRKESKKTDLSRVRYILSLDNKKTL